MSLCIICNEPCPQVTRRPRKYCSADCKHIAYFGKPKLERPTHCAVCKQPLESAGLRNPKLTCSRKCRDKKRLIDQKKQRRQQNKICIVCSQEFQWQSHIRICSDKCRTVRKEQYKERQQLSNPETKTVICGWCEKELVLPYSANAPRKYHPECKIQARRARDRIKTVRRQGYRTNYLVTHEEIASRDNYTCQLCQEPVDMSLPRTSKFGATLDHKIPISKGGTDNLENLQLAHWVCNNRKSDRTEYAESR